MKNLIKQIYGFTLVLTASLLMACTANTEIDNISNTNDNQGEIVNYTVDEALKTLNAFLDKTDGQTRSGHRRGIESIETYTSTSSGTRAIDGNDECQNKAYLINFTNNEGFAVLGANSNLPEIIAVVDNGHINNDLTIVPEAGSTIVDDDNDSTIPYWCEEDEDFYTMAINGSPTRLISSMIHTSMKVVEAPQSSGTAASSGKKYNEHKPMLTYSWGQEAPYYNYCLHKNGDQAVTGCSITALAMILTYLKYPYNLTIKGKKIDWDSMAGYPKYYNDLFSQYSYNRDWENCEKVEQKKTEAAENIALLMGYIYNNVFHISNGTEYTMITPRQIELIMRNKLCFTNVVRMCSTCFNDEMIAAVSKMLPQGKPVFISAIPFEHMIAGHSWVIDGAQYADKDYLLHFNFGWKGDYNGYFSTECLNPTKAVKYDENSYSDYNVEYDHIYDFHFRMITYDISYDYSFRKKESSPISLTF